MNDMVVKIALLAVSILMASCGECFYDAQYPTSCMDKLDPPVVGYAHGVMVRAENNYPGMECLEDFVAFSKSRYPKTNWPDIQIIYYDDVIYEPICPLARPRGCNGVQTGNEYRGGVLVRDLGGVFRDALIHEVVHLTLSMQHGEAMWAEERSFREAFLATEPRCE